MPQFPSCSHCGQTCATREFLNLHHAICLNKTLEIGIRRIVLCADKECSHHFTTVLGMRIHLRRIHGKFLCKHPNCTRIFASKAGAAGHFVQKHKTSRCHHEFCGELFLGTIRRKKHILQKHPADAIRCDHAGCSILSATRTSLIAHQLNVHAFDVMDWWAPISSYESVMTKEATEEVTEEVAAKEVVVKEEPYTSPVSENFTIVETCVCCDH